MTPEELQKQLVSIPVELERWMNDDAPRIIGKTAVDIYTRNFQREGFANNGLQPWQEVKRRLEGTMGKGAAASRKILTGETGNLGRAFDYQVGKGEVIIYNDARSAGGFPYGKVHQDGATDAGRGRSTVIPRRQIIGHSVELARLINMEISRKLKSLSKK